MWINAHLYDREHALRFFLEDFCTPGCRMKAAFHHASKFNAPRFRRSKNRDEVIKHTLYDTGLFPDLTFRLLSSKVIQRKGYVGSQIIFRVQMNGTVLRLDRRDDRSAASHKVCMHQRSFTNIVPSLPPAEECLLCKEKEQPWFHTPLQISCTTIISLYLDEFHRFYCMELSTC